jgi:protein SCO1/2
MLDGLEPGDLVVARLTVLGTKSELVKIRVTGKGPAPKVIDQGPSIIRPRELFPATQIELDDGTQITIGEGQDKATALTFLYTRCPMPDFCPLTVLRLQALQGEVTADQRIVAVTLDPDFDTAEVLQNFAQLANADAEIWRFGRMAGREELRHVAMRSGLNVAQGENGDIVHGMRLLVLDVEGRLVERYDDNYWPLERVAQQLKTGGPPSPSDSSGTVSPAPSE